jgi:hypothetical protein
MSDVPELDRLIEEHEIFRRNMQWEARERARAGISRVAIQAAIVSLAAIVVGPLAVLCIPLTWKWIKSAVPDPPRRDPFRKYRVL